MHLPYFVGDKKNSIQKRCCPISRSNVMVILNQLIWCNEYYGHFKLLRKLNVTYTQMEVFIKTWKYTNLKQSETPKVIYVCVQFVAHKLMKIQTVNFTLFNHLTFLLSVRASVRPTIINILSRPLLKNFCCDLIKILQE